jgi:hypothetical protein
LAPSSIAAGGDDFTIAVAGTGFVSSSVVQWNGVAKPTTYLSSSQLKAMVSSADLEAAGTVQVTVLTPGPGGGQSSASFTVSAPAAPTLTAISPTLATAGSADFTLSAGTGSNRIGGLHCSESAVLIERRADLAPQAMVLLCCMVDQMREGVPGKALSSPYRECRKSCLLLQYA